MAYSGGLDTSVMLCWLKETYGCEVVCYTADVGRGDELDGPEAKALASGALLYKERVVTFEDDAGAFDQSDAEGFIRLLALRLRLRKPDR